MAERPNKIARLQNLRARLPYVSQSALAQLLHIAQKEELPVGSSRQDIRDARDLFCQATTPYGKLHQVVSLKSTDKKDLRIEIQAPLPMLHHSTRLSSSLSDLIRRVHARSPSSPGTPWRLVFYGDEITPGNQLAYRNERKMWGFYWTLLEFGAAVLSGEEPSTTTFDLRSLAYVRETS